ncbi:hypothetical protein H9Q69_014357 [Fusarium xylarioides]|uniref:F-box domain-containing protein n=1 Tax=Fusarium xylarioides TaxID=221167 RepID=A0A9P7L141_9HYPO|nr:hypothetical protein H9Q70_014518 [Fusarium xylarioides]KAG5755047.1 hypothetical protein H9Q72_014464 [Fusarium xylarioides]KAG5767347.1 hypothetical protein H9Q73_014334 [Fusarium xylarioides]KAG5786561.1 hypothetical protein H9Q69_014357 [Fusarium xylarioides]
MAPLSLLDCPKEVQLGIAELLLQADAANLSMTCRALHSLTEPLVYSTIQITWTKQYYPPITKALLLLRALLERPDLRNHVRSIEFGGDGFIDYDDPPWPGETPEPPEVPDLPLDKLTAAIRRTGVSESTANEWISKVLYSDRHRHLNFREGLQLGIILITQSATSDAAAAVIVSLLPSLERLTVSENWYNEARLLGLMFQLALCRTDQHSTRSSQPTFSSLKHVSLDPMLHEDTNTEPNKVDQDLCLFYLPSIQQLSTSIQNLTPFSWPCASTPNPVSLTSLDIFRLRETRLAPVLSVAKNLKKLRYNWFYRPDFDKEVNTSTLMLDELAMALLEVKDSLEDLEITAETCLAYTMGDIEPPDFTLHESLVEMRGMRRLKTLNVPWSFLTGMTGLSATGRLGNALPQSLEHLILSRFRLRPVPHNDRDGVMVSAFEKELETGSL